MPTVSGKKLVGVRESADDASSSLLRKNQIGDNMLKAKGLGRKERVRVQGHADSSAGPQGRGRNRKMEESKNSNARSRQAARETPEERRQAPAPRTAM